MEDYGNNYQNNDSNLYNPPVPQKKPNKKIWLLILIPFLIIIIGLIVFLLMNSSPKLDNGRPPIKVNSSFKFDPSTINCPEDCEIINGYSIPKIVSALPTNNLSEFKSSSFYTLGECWDGNDFLGDWWNYQPMNNKVKELIQGITSDYEKAESILKWVKASRNYSPEEFSPTNEEKSYQEVFDSESGVCLDASLIAGTMLRKAGIPSLMMQVNFNHVVTLFKVGEQWYTFDPTFCQDTYPNCFENENMVEIGKNASRFMGWYCDAKASQSNSQGKYCDMSGMCYDSLRYSWKKYFIFDDNLVDVFIPNKGNFEYVTENGNTIRYDCSFRFGDLVCDMHGCWYFGGLSKSGEAVENWAKDFDFGRKSFKTDPERSNGFSGLLFYGYSFFRIPANKFYKYECRSIVFGDGAKDEIISLNYFNPNLNDTIIISPDTLIKFEGADEGLFNDLRANMADSLKDIDLNNFLN